MKIGTRDANKLKEWSKENPTVTFGSNEEAAKFGVCFSLNIKNEI